MAGRSPDLLAGYFEVIALVDRAGLERSQVRTGVGLRVSLTPGFLATEHRREQALFLRFGAPLDHGRTPLIDGRMVGHARRMGAFVLLVVDGLLDYSGAAATVLARPPDSNPSRRRQFFLKSPSFLEFLACCRNHIRGIGLEVFGQIGLQPRAQLHPESLLLRGVIKVHANLRSRSKRAFEI